MTRRPIRYALLGLGSLALAACAFLAFGRPGTRLSAAQAPAPSFAEVSVWSSDLDPQTTALYQSLANAVAGFSGVPDARGAYYSYYNDGITWAIGSWGASVTNAVPDGDGGYNVTLTVGPNFSISPGTHVAGTYYETYNVDANGVVTFVGWQDPDNCGGGPLVEFSA